MDIRYVVTSLKEGSTEHIYDTWRNRGNEIRLRMPLAA
jgi:hypothetical protein